MHILQICTILFTYLITAILCNSVITVCKYLYIDNSEVSFLCQLFSNLV